MYSGRFQRRPKSVSHTPPFNSQTTPSHKSSKFFFSHRISDITFIAKISRIPPFQDRLRMSNTHAEVSRTSEKQNPSQNAIRHGCCAVEALLLENEKIEDYRRLDQSMRAAYDAPTDWELDLLSHAIESEWFHLRATKAYAKVEAEIYKSTPDPAEWSEEQHKKLGRFLRYKTKHANDVRAHLKLLEGFKRKRQIEAKDAAAANLKQSKVDLKTEKEITKRNKSEKLALLEVLSHHGLVRYDDLEGVLDK
jgi:hypothetical protein